MSKYLLSVHGGETPGADVTPQVMERMFAQVGAFNDELQAAGVWVFAGGLHPASTASVVRSTNGTAVTTDGPYLETKEHIGGFWIVDLPDLDAALSWAGKASAACEGPVEVRPFQDDV